MNNRKREKPYSSRHAPYALHKRRRRPLPLDADDALQDSSSTSAAAKLQTSVVVIGVPTDCSVLDIKSRFEMYGPISRTRMEPNGVAHVNFRSADAAQSAVDAARDSSFPITLNSTPVQVVLASDPIPQWERGIGRNDGLSSKLVRAELPLSRHGRGNKLGSAIVNPRDDKSTIIDPIGEDDKLKGAIAADSGMDRTFKGREIVAYDDIL
ncbi:uncharacterized protein At1g27050 [Andrographis paniculata]|uniref:uncharacterized protein At1g27050 n=1 Tax=Andrographis paniculata TaxID=175694 RepID=UPI0021E8899A|nr:uncharacterized protein At1g27050 [Andrographis paniculata]